MYRSRLQLSYYDISNYAVSNLRESKPRSKPKTYPQLCIYTQQASEFRELSCSIDFSSYRLLKQGYSAKAVHATFSFIACRVLFTIPIPYVLPWSAPGNLFKEITQNSRALSAACTFLWGSVLFVTATLPIVTTKNSRCKSTCHTVTTCSTYFLRCQLHLFSNILNSLITIIREND